MSGQNRGSRAGGIVSAVRRWLAWPALTWGALILIAAAVAAADGIRALAGISYAMTLLIVAGLVIAGRAAGDLTRWMLRRKAR